MSVITQRKRLSIIVLTLLAFIFCAAPPGWGQKAILPRPAAQEAEFYVCPMHPDLQANSPGKCPKCGMTLVRRAPAAPAGKFQIELKSTPAVIRPSEKVQFSFRIFNPDTHTLVREFNIVHEKPFHLFVVSQDLTQFQHIHPIQQADGSFLVETVLPAPGSYKLFCDFFP